MKIKKFNENQLISLENIIYDIIADNVEIGRVRYSDDYEIVDDSRIKAAKSIIEFLKSEGLLFALDTKKYNL